MAELNKKLYAVINGEPKRLLKLQQVKNGIKIDSTNMSAVIEKVIKNFVDFAKNLIFAWEKYSAIAHITKDIWVPSIDVPLSEIKGLDYSDIEADYGSADTRWEGDEILGNAPAWYKSISLDENGEIIGSGSATYETANYVRKYGQEWYYIVERDDVQQMPGYLTGTMRAYELNVLEITEYSKGDYIEIITAENEDAYPENGYQDGFWYVKTDKIPVEELEVVYDEEGNLSILNANAVVDDDGNVFFSQVNGTLDDEGELLITKG